MTFSLALARFMLPRLTTDRHRRADKNSDTKE